MGLWFFSTEFFSMWLPVFIFLARVTDVSLGTLKFIFISKGHKYAAPIIGFFEISVWLFAISGIINNLNHPAILLAYALGFASGTFVGMWIEERLSLGKVLIQVVAKNNAPQVIGQLKLHNHKITSINAEGFKGEVKFIFAVIERNDVKEFLGIVKSIEPDAFYTIEDVKSVSEGMLAPKKKRFFGDFVAQFHWTRKGK